MTHKHQNDVIDAVDFMRASFGTEKHQEIQQELAEVYRKAEAFDEIFRLYIGYEDGWIHFPRGSKSFNKEIINVCKYYESGEHDGNPVKPIEAGMDEVYVMFHECPDCGGEDIIYGFNFCPVCGVKLDWSDVE